MILALEFDGVYPVRTTTEPKFCHMDILEVWLQKRPAVNILISSSWREAHPLALLLDTMLCDERLDGDGEVSRMSMLKGTR